MIDLEKYEDGIWFVYDGDCPICASAASALQIKNKFGALHTINARVTERSPLLNEINNRGYDLDEGMVIYHKCKFYFGKDALKFMAKHSKARGLFNWFSKSFFWSNTIAALTYPWMRAVRNHMIRRRGVNKIDNLNLKLVPTFQGIFGQAWNDLPPVMKKHYANRPYSSDRVTVEGKLDVECHGIIRALKPLFLLLRAIPPFTETNVPVTVHFDSENDTKSFGFNRVFHFKNGNDYRFRSKMIPMSGNEVIEIMRFNIGWRCKFLWQNNKVILKHNGYAIKLFGHIIPLPITWIMGSGYAEEKAIDDDSFEMFVEITHPWWGKIYGYNGTFTVTEVKC